MALSLWDVAGGEVDPAAGGTLLKIWAGCPAIRDQ